MYDDDALYTSDQVGQCTDIGNALRLAYRFEHDLRYVPTHGWLRDTGHRLEQLYGLPLYESTLLPTLIMQEVASLPPTSDAADRAKELIKWAEKSASEARLRSALYIMSDIPFIRTTHDKLDRDPLTLNTPGGAFDLRDGQYRETLAGDLLTRSTRVRPVDPAKGQVWDTFLRQILPSQDVRTYVQRAVGYSLTGLTREETFFILHGQGQNGKSKLLNALAYALGNYAHAFDPKLILQQRFEGHPTNIASLHGTRFTYSNEIDQGAQLDEGRIKALTGGDLITARFMRKDEFTFVPTHKLWLATNHLPIIKGTDKGMWRRVSVIPFDVDIPDEQRDIRLEEKLHAEAGSILAWAIDGAIDYLHNGLAAPAEVAMASAHYKQEQDSVGIFINEETTPDPNGYTPAGDLYSSYKRWCEDNGHKVITSTAFGRDMTARGFVGGKRQNRKTREGLTLNQRSWV